MLRNCSDVSDCVRDTLVLQMLRIIQVCKSITSCPTIARLRTLGVAHSLVDQVPGLCWPNSHRKLLGFACCHTANGFPWVTTSKCGCHLFNVHSGRAFRDIVHVNCNSVCVRGKGHTLRPQGHRCHTAWHVSSHTMLGLSLSHVLFL